MKALLELLAACPPVLYLMQYVIHDKRSLQEWYVSHSSLAD